MLSIRIDYLMGCAYAGDFGDRSLPEWPPHPARFFSATVSALHDAQNPPEEREALEWLAAQGLPDVFASAHTERSAPETYVVSNYEGKSGSPMPESRDKQKRYFPVVRPDLPQAYFIWPNADPCQTTRDTLARLLQRVGYLGRSHSIVTVSVSDAPPRRNYVPNDRGDVTLRVFGRNRIRELEVAHNAELWPVPTTQQAYLKAEGEVKAIRSGPFERILVLRFEKGIRLPIDATLTLTGTLRQAVMDLADRNGALSDLIHGHGVTHEGPSPHVAYVALADIGHKFARGEIKGLGLVAPRGTPVERHRELVRILQQLRELTGPGIPGSLKVALSDAPLTPSMAALNPSTWSRPSAVWTTATPILLDRYPKRHLSAEDIVRESLERSGLPTPTTVLCSGLGRLAGVPPVSQFRLRRKASDPKRWAVHASIEFAESIEGPLLLGAGRFFGLGLLRPLESTEANRD